MTKSIILPGLLLILSNTFMTFAWYGHLKFENKPLWLVILASWGIAFFEYCFQVPANRIGNMAGTSAAQLKIMQEAITLVVFVVFARLYFNQRLAWNYYLAFGLILGAVALIFLVHPGPATPANPSQKVASQDVR